MRAAALSRRAGLEVWGPSKVGIAQACTCDLAPERSLVFNQNDAKMHHMKRATVRDLRYRFREVEYLLREGDEIQITKRKRVIATLIPSKPATPSRRPDFLARLRKIYRNKPLKVTGAELISRERGRY